MVKFENKSSLVNPVDLHPIISLAHVIPRRPCLTTTSLRKRPFPTAQNFWCFFKKILLIGTRLMICFLMLLWVSRLWCVNLSSIILEIRPTQCGDKERVDLERSRKRFNHFLGYSQSTPSFFLQLPPILKFVQTLKLSTHNIE